MADIYGERIKHPKRVGITSQIYQRWARTPWETKAERETLAKQHGIKAIGSYGGDGVTGFFLGEAHQTEKLSYWVPHFFEREILRRVICSVCSNNKKPTVLEVGCGSGLLAALLGADNKINIVGIDIDIKNPNGTRISTAPNTFLLKTDIWNVVNNYSHKYPGEIQIKREKLLSAVRNRERSFFLYELYGGWFGDPKELNQEIDVLQRSSRATEQETSIDVVICSFMEMGAELTVPIRDGIYPKAIIYVRPMNGRSGGGDYYFAKSGGNFFDIDKWNQQAEQDKLEPEGDGSEEELQKLLAIINANTNISYHPGTNYTTKARWITPCQLSYDSGKHRFDSDRDFAEVIIQTRNDTKFTPTPSPQIHEYPFDLEIESAFGQSSPFEKHANEMNQARQLLFP